MKNHGQSTNALTRALASAQETKALPERLGLRAFIGENLATEFRIYTEARENLGELASRYFAGFTLTPAVGYWQGTPERSTVIEVIGTFADRHAAVALAAAIAEANAQDAVLLTWRNAATFEKALVSADVAQTLTRQ